MKMKKVLSILTVLTLVLFPGCWDYNEYENLALISAVGIDTDSTNSQVTITVEYLEPAGRSSDSKEASNSIVVKATGPSLADAYAKIQEATGKKLFFGYMEETVIGENAAKEMMDDIIEYANRTPTVRTSAYLVITKGTAENVLSTTSPKISQSTGKYIHSLIDQSLNSGSAFPVRLQDFEEELSIIGEEPVAPMITAGSSAQSKNSSSSTDTDTYEEITEQGSIKPNEIKKGYENIDGIAAFKNGKLVGWLKGRECTGLGWIKNKRISPYEIVNTTSEKNVQNTLIFRITGSKCNIKINDNGSTPVISINTYVEADLRKYSKNLDFKSLTSDNIKLLERELANNVSTDISDAVKEGQNQLKTDIFGIGFNFYRQYPALWHSQFEKRWREIFQTLQINVNVTAKVTNTGTSIKKFSVR